MHQFPFLWTNKQKKKKKCWSKKKGKQNKYAESGKMKIQEESATGFPVQNCSFLMKFKVISTLDYTNIPPSPIKSIFLSLLLFLMTNFIFMVILSRIFCICIVCAWELVGKGAM